MRDGSRETQELDLYWKLNQLPGKHGIEIRIWSLSEDNTQSWVRISHGSNKFVIDSNNNNNTESPEDLPEEQASQLKVKDLQPDQRQKQNHKGENLLIIHRASFR